MSILKWVKYGPTKIGVLKFDQLRVPDSLLLDWDSQNLVPMHPGLF